MRELEERAVSCPYCGERIDVLIDPSAGGQEYVEDCQVCCRPIEFVITLSGSGAVSISVAADYE